ncbi:hypothetical protein SBA4_90024 [Candidatus Sulfopaludibacter sp. SbA4]|nr:hypothetical protein SBA4_90024 [Candidatus Sulfopaludibacter sp. SbA4]
MRYDEYLAKGWPIASGPVEGACKNLIEDRMERSGMRAKINCAFIPATGASSYSSHTQIKTMWLSDSFADG